MRKLYLFILSVFFFSSGAFALILEDLPQAKLYELLSGKKVGYYIGSFDPIHKGHEQLASIILSQNLVDYCLIYPAWGGDHYKNRTDVAIRLDMLFSLYRDNPKIIVTKLSPKSLQKLLTIDSSMKVSGKPAVVSAIENVKYIGVLGSDTALNIVADTKKLSVFMRGIKIPEKYHEHTIGGIIALPAKEFIVSLREGDNIDALNNRIADRPIISILKPINNRASSTEARNKIKNSDSATALLSPKVIEIIRNRKLYK